MTSTRKVTIAGGGLAGLALGLALRRYEIEVDLHEAGVYPRHRVCGEFIAGLDSETRDRLGLGPFLEDALRHEELVWFQGHHAALRQHLPSPALALSRHTLDARLADAFRAAGGRLYERSRLPNSEALEGRVLAHGRRRGRSRWIGLKVHLRNLTLAAGLELHLGNCAYAGLCALPDGDVNVSGLFLQRPGITAGRKDLLDAYLRASDLDSLAERLASAAVDGNSHCAVAGLTFSPSRPRAGHLALGDAWAMIPPFTGNGMAMAFQSAALAVRPLVAWARDELTWGCATDEIEQALHRRFRLRLASARPLHSWLLHPSRQRWLAWAARNGLLPLRSLYRVLH